MIKTLRITSIIAAFLAVASTVLPAVRGARSGDEEGKEIEQLLNSPGVVEKFRQVMGAKASAGKGEIPPLVKQAEAFGLYLNPPPPPKPKKRPKPQQTQGQPTITRSPTGPVSAKFKLIGTCYYPLHPELSLVLIDEPGKDLRWVRQSGRVGHLIVEQVKDGLVVIRDGERTFEQPVIERPPKTNLLKGPPPKETAMVSGASAEVAAGTSSGKAAEATAKDRVGEVSASDKAGAAAERHKAAQVSERESALMEKFMGELTALQAGAESGKIDSQQSEEERAVLMKKLISGLEAARINAEEARKLEDLGKELKEVQQEQAKSRKESRKDGKVNRSKSRKTDRTRERRPPVRARDRSRSKAKDK